MENEVYEKFVYSLLPSKIRDNLEAFVIPFCQTEGLVVAQGDGFCVTFVERNDDFCLTFEKGDTNAIIKFGDLSQKQKYCKCSKGILGFQESSGIEYLFAAYSNGISGKSILRNSSLKTVSWELLISNMVCRVTAEGTVEFNNSQTGEIEFYLSTPYLEDGGGKVFTCVSFDLNIEKDSIHLLLKLNEDLIKYCEWVSPMTIHWRIIVPEKNNISTYSKFGKGLVETPFHIIGGEPLEENEMFLKIRTSYFESIDAVEKAYLMLSSSEVFSDDRNVYDLELYKIESLQLVDNEKFVDRVPLRYSWSAEGGDDPTYLFDITNLFMECFNDTLTEVYLKIKLEKRAKGYENYVVLHGANSNILFAPKIIFEYQKRENHQ